MAWRLACGLLLGLPGASSAGFEQGIVEIHRTSAHIPVLATCPDERNGAIVAWQEGEPGPLRALHLAANGELDGSEGWLTATADPDPASRSRLAAVSDVRGGAYLAWCVADVLHLSRITADGRPAEGWPRNGRVLGRLRSGDRPSLVPDGEGGLYIGWFDTGIPSVQPWRVLAFHVGPDGRGAGGWPDTPLGFESPLEATLGLHPVFAAASGGGLWAAWLGAAPDAGGQSLVGGYRVTRLRPSGAAYPGWTRQGTELVPLGGALRLTGSGAMRPVAISDDGEGGCLLLTWDVGRPVDGSYLEEPANLRRFAADGAVAPGWPEAGIPVWGTYYSGAGFGASPSVRRSRSGDVILGTPVFGLHGSELFQWFRVEGDFGSMHLLASVNRASDLKVRARGDLLGVAWAQSYGWRNGPERQSAQVSGGLFVPGTPSSTFFESREGVWDVWYGDADIVLTELGSAILVWSQNIDRHGLQAIRLLPRGPMAVEATPGEGSAMLRAHHSPGRGVVAEVAWPGRGAVALGLVDIAGRASSRAELAAERSAGAAIVLPGSQDLPPGVYFVVATRGGRSLSRRVLVLDRR